MLVDLLEKVISHGIQNLFVSSVVPYLIFWPVQPVARWFVIEGEFHLFEAN